MDGQCFRYTSMILKITATVFDQGYMLQHAIKYFLPTITILVFISSACADAEVFSGRVLRFNGDVHIIDAAGECRTVDETGLLVRELDTVVTAEGSHAVVRFNDGALSVLDENSRLQVEKSRWLSHLGGKIYFTFRKIFGKPRMVKTRFATLGIRGTTFIVYDDDTDQGVALQEGLLDIESPGAAFEIHRQQALDEFETFKQQALEEQKELRREYEDYRKQMQHEFIEYKQNFILRANYLVRFDGNRVDESEIDEHVVAEFENFEAIAGDLLEQFREQAQAHRERMEEEQRAKELEDESLFDDY